MKRTKQTLQYSNLSSKYLYFTDLCREVRRDICDFLEEEDETNLESQAEVNKRLRKFKRFLKEKTTPQQKVLIISHRDFIHELANKKCSLPNNAEFMTVQLE